MLEQITGATFQDMNGDDQNGIIFHFVDGQWGDSDLTTNRRISTLGAPAFNLNTPPIANDDNVITDEDTPIILDLLANDTDADGDSLAFSFIDDPGYGILTLNHDDTLTYTPQPNFNGTDTFHYGITDGIDTATAIVNITINPVNDPPTLPYPAGEVDIRQGEYFSYTFPEITDVDGDTIYYAFGFCTLPGISCHGGITGNISGTTLLEGNHSIYVYAFDSSWEIAQSLFYITVYPANHPPTLSDIFKSGDEDTVINFSETDFTSAFYDPEYYGYDSLQKIQILQLPIHGILQLNGENVFPNQEISSYDLNSLTYTPDPNFNSDLSGGDSFVWTGSDGELYADFPALVSLDVNPVNDAPTLQQEIADQTAIENQPLSFIIPETTFSDVDGDSLSYSLAEGTVLPAGITFDAATATLSGTPTAAGTYNLTVVAADAGNATASDTFSLQVFHPIDVPPSGAVISGTNQNDIIDASSKTGTYRLESGDGDDLLIGSNQRDVLKGSTGNDRLYGGGDIDKLYGEEGDDLLDGGTGLDFLYGGAGADRFVLAMGNGSDRVIDFNAAAGDLFALNGLSFGQLSFNNNQILAGGEMLTQVTDNLGNPVTGFDTHPEWFVTI